ncbi:2-iminobutanoate/2-iminopropanoate deaminase [Paenibacillus allorhizoplanae]|uniref:2-iminobutanoate/2-iminopropanoate deaminase n=1 Tax=Paenibacillus allorhizoplanae TaxID=2905648 RepID=A0ABN8GXF0_9BACL|nr:Rid family detoxifying hydrolase [Paenibacillus allorhizoplanae]CAH1221322.1 2-iminobutanoate/2-iminopropanoate deaminase [Paenibacillus allorhizoplanae]
MVNKWVKVEINTTGAPQNTGPYSQGIRVGNLIFTSGEGPLDPLTGEIVEGSIEEQTRLVFRNLEAILHAAGASLQDVVKVTAHLADLNDFERFNHVYKEIFPGPVRPVRTTVGSQLTVRVEVDVVAVLPEG